MVMTNFPPDHFASVGVTGFEIDMDRRGPVDWTGANDQAMSDGDCPAEGQWVPHRSAMSGTGKMADFCHF